MKLRAFFVLTILLILLALIPWRSGNGRAEAAETRRFLEAAVAQIEAAQPGQIVHVAEIRFNRAPPDNLEPVDPYHLPYSEIWRETEYVDRWIEIGEDGLISRWRTQVRNERHELLQDLLFDHGVEVGYFVAEGWAYRIEYEPSRYRDGRLVLIEDFLQREDLSRRVSELPDGRVVLSIYAEPESYGGSFRSIRESLAYFNRPFEADLQPVTRALRIDFDRQTLLPVGEARVVWDRDGIEHLVSYNAFVDYRIMPAAGTLFQIEIPGHAFRDSHSVMPNPRMVTGLPQILREVDYPVYALPANTPDFARVVAALVLPEEPTAQSTRAAGGNTLFYKVGVNTTYVFRDTIGRSISIVQAPAPEMTAALRQVRPMWLEADRIQAQLGEGEVVVWALHGLDSTDVYYVLEAGETILFVHARSVPHETVLHFFASLAPSG
jgi:hypothetical protein